MNEIKSLLGALAFFYITLSLVVVGFGLADPGGLCDEPRRRIAYVFPTYSLGCWLGEVPYSGRFGKKVDFDGR